MHSTADSSSFSYTFNPLNSQLNPICHLLALSGTNRNLQVSKIRVKQFYAFVLNFKCESRYLLLMEWSRYSPDVAQRMGRGIAVLFHDRGTRRGWMVNSTPWPHFTPGKDPVPILQEAGWAPGPVWTGGKSRPHGDSIPDRPVRSSLAIPTELPGPHISSSCSM